MQQIDDFSDYYADLLGGAYDCVGRFVLNAHFFVGQRGGGIRRWWRGLYGMDENPTEARLRRMARQSSRRRRVAAKAKGPPDLQQAR